MIKKIYLAGPISGLYIKQNREHFHEVEYHVSHHWFGNDQKAVMNPAVLPLGFSQQEYMAICVPMLMACDVVVMLREWEDSEGACIEYNLAKKCGKTIFDEVGQLLFQPPRNISVVPEGAPISGRD